MNQKRILTIQDISCVGQCSLTVALPILSAMGIETAVLPSAVLSTHTGGFKGYTFRDLTEDIVPYFDHLMSLGRGFACHQRALEKRRHQIWSHLHWLCWFSKTTAIYSRHIQRDKNRRRETHRRPGHGRPWKTICRL